MQRARKRKSGGFSLIEVLAAMAVLGIAASAVAAGLLSASNSVGRTLKKSGANSIAQTVLEQVRALPYDKVGLQGGNPAGNVSSSQTITKDGINFAVETKIAYVDDESQAYHHTYSDRKKIEVLVTRPGTSQTISQTTFISPPSYETIEGRGTILLDVKDLLTGTPIPDVVATADLSTSPTQIDTTDSLGRVIFAGLLPSAPLSGNPKYNYRLQLARPGYQTSKASLQATDNKKHLLKDETQTVTLTMFKPVAMTVLVHDPTGNPIPGTVSLSVNHPTLGTNGVGLTAPSNTISTLGGYPLEPAGSVTLTASASCRETLTTSGPLPGGYPSTLSRTFDLTMWDYPSVRVHLQNPSTGTGAAGVPVNASYVNGSASVTTNSSGDATFPCVKSGTFTYSVGASWTYQAGGTSFTVQSLSSGGADVQATTFTLSRVTPDCDQATQARIYPRLFDLGGAPTQIAPASFTVAGLTKSLDGAGLPGFCVDAPTQVTVTATPPTSPTYLPTTASAGVSVSAGGTYSPGIYVKAASAPCSIKVIGTIIPDTLNRDVQIYPNPFTTPVLSQPALFGNLGLLRAFTFSGLVPGVGYTVKVKTSGGTWGTTNNGPSYTCSAGTTSTYSNVQP